MISKEEIKKKLIVFSNRLSDLVDDYQYTQGKTKAQQADEMHLTKGNLSKYKSSNNKDKSIPDIQASTLMRIADYYGVSTDYLLGNTDCKTAVGTNKKKLIRAICDYTGLQEQTIKKISETKTSVFKRLIINEILQNDKLVEDLMLYYASSFLDIYKSSHYYDLPQFYEHSDILECDSTKAKKMQAYSLHESLASSREDIYKNNTQDENHKLTMALAMAQIFVDKFNARKKIEESAVSPIEAGANAIGSQQLKTDQEIIEHQQKLLVEIENQELPYRESRFNSDPFAL